MKPDSSRSDHVHRAAAELLEVARLACGARFGVVRLQGCEPIATDAGIPLDLEEPLARQVAALDEPYAVLDAPFSREIRFYAAARLVDSNGRFRGTFALLDDRTRAWSAEQERALLTIAWHFARELDMAEALDEDSTKCKRMEHQLAQLDRLTSVGRLAAQIAHEFNNVLMGIQPIVEVIRRRTDDPALQQWTDIISGSIARGKRITSDVLRFGRPAQLAVTAVGVHDLLRHAADEIRPSLPENIAFLFAFADTPMVIQADTAQLAQVLVNLAANAREAMQERGGTLTIAARPANPNETGCTQPFIHITVSDTGCGIPPDDLPYVFEPLFTTKKRGTGLGLSVVMQIVAAHGGHVSVESEVGRGTTFHLYIPAAAQQEETRSLPARQASLPAPPLRVLIVEDEEAVASGLRWGLESEGMTVRIATTGAEALPAISAFEPDLVVLDLALPDEDGKTTYARIAERHDLPVIFSSGNGSEAEIERLGDPQHTAFLMKPYSLDELLGTMRRLVEGKGADG